MRIESFELARTVKRRQVQSREFYVLLSPIFIELLVHYTEENRTHCSKAQ